MQYAHTYAAVGDITAERMWEGGCNSRPLRTLFRGGDIVSVGYAIAHPRLNTVGILPPGSRPSDVAAVCIHLCRVCNRAAVVFIGVIAAIPT